MILPCLRETAIELGDMSAGSRKIGGALVLASIGVRLISQQQVLLEEGDDLLHCCLQLHWTQGQPVQRPTESLPFSGLEEREGCRTLEEPTIQLETQLQEVDIVLGLLRLRFGRLARLKPSSIRPEETRPIRRRPGSDGFAKQLASLCSVA